MDDLEVMPLERVEAELCSYAARLAGGMCRWLQLVSEFDRRDGASSWGMASTASWLAWRTAVDGRTAREHVRVARALRELPAVTAAFATGELSFAKVRALTRVARPELDEEFVTVARHATCDELEQIVSAFRRSADELSTVAAAHHDARRATSGYDDDGRYRLRAEMAAAEGAVVERALEVAVERLRVEDQGASGSAEPPLRTFPQLRADALVEMARCYLARGDASADDGDRYLVLLTAEAGGDGAGAGAGEIVGGPPLPAETLDRLRCTEPRALLVHDGVGNPLWMGRKTRHANRAQRRALARRDSGRCAFPGCRVGSRLVPHHSDEWVADHGPTDIDRLVLLCRYHHRCVHEGGFRVRRPEAAAGFEFVRPDGRVIPTDAPSGSAEPLPDAAVAAPAAGDRLPFDLDLTIDALLCAAAEGGGPTSSAPLGAA